MWKVWKYDGKCTGLDANGRGCIESDKAESRIEGTRPLKA